MRLTSVGRKLLPVASNADLSSGVYLYRATGNLVVAMVVHGINNGVFLTLMILIPGFH